VLGNAVISIFHPPKYDGAMKKNNSLNDIKKFIEKATTEHIKFGDIHYRSFILIDNKSKTPKKLFNNLMKVMKIDPGKRKGW